MIDHPTVIARRERARRARRGRATVEAPPLPPASDPIWRRGHDVVRLVYEYLTDTGEIDYWDLLMHPTWPAPALASSAEGAR